MHVPTAINLHSWSAAAAVTRFLQLKSDLLKWYFVAKGGRAVNHRPSAQKVLAVNSNHQVARIFGVYNYGHQLRLV